MRKLNSKKGFTLVEILIAVSLFASVGVMCLTIFINITRIQGQLALENAIYEDARFMMERISRSIRNNAIDYEEYFNKTLSSDNQYGEMYGCYAAQFYNPGLGTHELPGPNLTASPGFLGAICNDATLYTGQGCVVFKPSIDLNTGMYPHHGAPGTVASNAFCAKYKFDLPAGCTVSNENERDELYLINADGDLKTIFALNKVGVTSDGDNEYALAQVEKNGEDNNGDGLTESWNGCNSGTNKFCCTDDYDCDLAVGETLETTLTAGDIYKGFVPISPLRTTIKRLVFSISPGEDPRKAFAEDSAIYQPRVRITLEVEPSEEQMERVGLPEDFGIPSIVLQTTVSSRIQSEVDSYLGPDTHNLSGTVTPKCLLSGDF
jgi:prepilin-type N-terminal cleavage/methylation domain-containing protein